MENASIIDKGKRIKDIRQALGLSLKRFALLCGVHENTCGFWEHNKTSPTLDAFDRFSTLGINALPYISGQTEVRFIVPVEDAREMVARLLKKIEG